ncbi:M20/M25/M40 family metallo-hydrolase, partial [bacterium]|nr:M20/M25/M40 family metallo-hydrolase [bacterium]
MLKDIVKTFCDLVKIPSPSGNEKNVMKYIKSYLKKINVKYELDNAGKYVKSNSGNLIAKIGNGKPTLMFVAHVDTVEDGKKQIKPVIKSGIIKSDGTTILGSDDKAGVAALLEAVKEVKDRKNLPITFAVFAVNEEKAPMGVKYLKIREKIDFVFDIDGSNKPGTFANKALGYISFKIHIYGKEAHAAMNPEKGANAIKTAGIIISKLKLQADSKGTLNIG